MAGMLPGVESARRRRCWGSSTGWWSESPSSSSGYNHGSSSNSTRRSSLCLYTSNHNSLLSSISNSHLQKRSMVNNQDEKLGGVAREAKERLDERLRAQYRKSEPKRRNSQERVRVVDQDQTNSAAVTTAAGGLKKSASKRVMSWAKLSSWKSSEQDECAVCLEQFRDSDNLAHLPCAHRFHSTCLVPWLENNAHCPCCRTLI